MRAVCGVMALLVALIGLTGCAREEETVPELLEPVGVQPDMAAAYIGEICLVDTYDGAVTPYVEALSFEADGRVAQMAAYAGKEVAKGDVLIELDQTDAMERAEDLREALAYAEQDNAYTDALDQLALEKLRTELQSMRAQGAEADDIALKELEIRERETSQRQARALREPLLEDQRRELAEIEASFEKNCLYAPFSGRVVYSEALHKGDWVSAYKPVIYLVDDSRLTLSSEYISEMTVRSANRLYAHIGANTYDLELLPYDQTELISRMLSGGTIRNHYAITGPEELFDQLEAGQYAAICLMSRYVPDALLVPTGAILRDASGSYVYVDDDGRRVRRAVKTGVSNDMLVEITEGLEEGEIVYVRD